MYENPFITRIDIKVLLLLASSYGYQDRHFKRAEYNKPGTVHRIPMPVCIKDGQNLEKPIFTPYIKAEQGAYDENILPETRFILIFFLTL